MIKGFKAFTPTQLLELKQIYIDRLVKGSVPSKGSNADYLLGKDNQIKELIIEIETLE